VVLPFIILQFQECVGWQIAQDHAAFMKQSDFQENFCLKGLK